MIETSTIMKQIAKVDKYNSKGYYSNMSTYVSCNL